MHGRHTIPMSTRRLIILCRYLTLIAIEYTDNRQLQACLQYVYTDIHHNDETVLQF